MEAQVLATTANSPVLVTSWPHLRTAGIADHEYSALLNAVNSDLQDDSWPIDLQEYKRHKNNMSSVDRVVIYKGRAVVPASLRQNVLQSLHQSHQGVLGMNLRSQTLVWWPNISKDIENIHHKNAPTQSPLPPVSPPLPEHPLVDVKHGSPMVWIPSSQTGFSPPACVA